MTEVGNGILCQDSQPVGGNQFRDTVVDFRIDMVRTACQHDAAFVVCLHPRQDFFAFFTHIVPGSCHFIPACAGCGSDFCCRNVGKLLDQRLGSDFKGRKRQERIAEFHFLAADFLHIVLDIFRIGCNDRAVVVVVCLRCFVSFIEQRRVEDKRNSLLNEPGHMSVGKLCRVTFGFAGNGFDAQRINVVVGSGGQDNLIAQLCKKGKPERIVFIHI